MEVSDLSQNIVFKEFEDKAYKEYYNLEEVLLNKDILNLSNYSITYGITFKYCFNVFENFMVNKDKNRASLLIALKYLYKYKKYLNTYAIQSYFVKMLYSLFVSLTVEHEKYGNEIHQLCGFIEYVLKTSFKKVLPLEHHGIHKNHNQIAAEFLHSQGYISSLELIFNLNKYERKDYIDETVVNFYNIILNIIIKQFYDSLKIKNKEEFALLLINNGKDNIKLNDESFLSDTPRMSLNLKTYETSKGFMQYLKPNNEKDKQIILEGLLNSHLYLSHALVKEWFENYEY